MSGTEGEASDMGGGGPDWSRSVRGIDLMRVGRLRRRGFRDTVRAIGRQERQRVVPLPLALGAIALPFLAAWAAAAPAQGGALAPGGNGAAPSVAAGPRPPAELDREHRLPEDPGGYVDIWGPAAEWEEQLLARTGGPERGGAGASAE